MSVRGVPLAALALALATAAAGGQVPGPWRAAVPAGWTVLDSAMGDLDGDGSDDAVLVLEAATPVRRVAEGGMCAGELTVTPRRLLVLRRDPAGFVPVAVTDRLVPPQDDVDVPCREDPYREGGGVTIARGALRVALRFWTSAGSWGVSGVTFILRLEAGRMRLIGTEAWDFMRNSGARREASTNFLTGRRTRTTGLNEFEPAAARPVVAWSRLARRAPLYLEDLRPECEPGMAPGSWCD